MCDERERLIGFIYDECDADERRQVETHLESCTVCRAEIRGLRSVREDLLAWNVPDHAPVWRPAAVVAPVWWRQVPTWALATAAAVMLVAGVAGGAATRLLAPAPAQAAGVTADELSAVQQQLVAMLRAELEQVRPVDPRVAVVSAPADSADAVERRILTRLGETDQKTLDQVSTLWSDFNKMKQVSDQNVRKLRQEVEELRLSIERQGGGR